MTDLFSPASRLVILGWYHLVAFGLLIPFLVVRSRRRIVDVTSPLPSRMGHFRTTTIMLVLFGAFSILVARDERIDLFPRHAPPPIAIAAGVVMYFATVGFMRPRWRRAVVKKARIVHLFMPENAVERAWWIAVSVLAGVSEEITWRGVQTVLLSSLVGSYGLAVVICAVMFGLAHYVQGWRAAGIITVFALGFSGVVWLSGSLYVAMAVHVVYDITAGLAYGRLGRELGYRGDSSTGSGSTTGVAPSSGGVES